MSLLQALLLGVLQGLTEFLPISSTAHLLLVPWALGWSFPKDQQFAFTVLVQDGTLLAVIAYFRRDLRAVLKGAVAGIARLAPLGTPEARLGWWIVLGTIPGVACALSLKEVLKELHGRPAVSAAVLLGATALLFLGERFGRRERGLETMTAGDALLVGCSQILALVPGVSRSGATITGGLLRHLDRTAAARFSFLLSIPVMLGAGIHQTVEMCGRPGAVDELPPLVVGFLAAAAVGYASIPWLLGFPARRPLTAFAWYRVAAGAGFLALVLYRA